MDGMRRATQVRIVDSDTFQWPICNTLRMLTDVFARLQEEFEETVATNMKEFEMEVGFKTAVILCTCRFWPHSC